MDFFTICVYILAVLVAWIWVDYFRMIDIYQKLTFPPVIITFIIGFLSPYLVTWTNDFFLDLSDFEMNDTFFNDFLYCWFRIGLLEETVKLVPFFIVLAIFEKKFEEPIDFIIFACVSALGFSAAENILYFLHYDTFLTMELRPLVTSIVHMACTAIAAYGVVLYKYRPDKFGLWVIPLALLMAAFSHGLYDFWLMYNEAIAWNGQFISFFYFLIMISIFSTILNNSMNNSPHFHYGKVVDPTKVSNRLILYYIVFILLSAALYVSKGDYDTLIFLILPPNIMFVGFLIIVICIRLSRFTLIQGRWNPIRIELPFTIHPGALFFRFRIRGEGTSDIRICRYYQQHFLIAPFSPQNSWIRTSKEVFLEQKIFLKNDQALYLIKARTEVGEGHFKYYLLTPKRKGMDTTRSGYPIVGLLEIQNMDDIQNTSLGHDHFGFLEWVYIKPN